MLARELDQAAPPADIDADIDAGIDDDVLRLVFACCHPVLPRESRVALTLRLVGGLTTPEIARAFLVAGPTIGQRISRAKRTLADAGVPFAVPAGDELQPRLASVLEVVYLVFNEGYSATAGDAWMRTELQAEGLRLGRVLAGLVPEQPEVHGLLALMALQSSRQAARVGPAGEPVLLDDQDRSRWDGPDRRGARGAGARGGARDAARSVPAAGRDRRLPRARGDARGDRLDRDRRSLRGALAARREPGRRAQPRRRARPRVRAGARAGGRRRARRRAGAGRLPPAAERPRRPARVAGARRGGGRSVHARRRAGRQRPRARPAARARPGVRGTLTPRRPR